MSDAAVDARGASIQRRTALASVVAAATLVAIKLVGGAIAGSLGLLAEAAHSGTDLVAALLSLFAIRVALRPADDQHHYGHGKAQHLAALGESAFLALVSLAIAVVAVLRLAGDGPGHAVEAAWWSIALLLVVIAIDASRMTVSARVARTHGSPALAANALHFASDLAGSLAVLVGLLAVRAGYPEGDAIAALLVALLVVVAAYRLARRSVDVLMDRAPAAHETAIRAVLERIAGVELRRLRIRHAAGRSFADLVVAVASDKALAQAHATADDVERAVEAALGDADVVVHVEPADEFGSLRERATAAALAAADVREVHNVRVIDVDGRYECSLHAKLPADLPLADAHASAEALERQVRAAVPELARVHTHIEPLAETEGASRPAHTEVASERVAIEQAVARVTGQRPHELRFRDSASGRIALVSIALPADQTLAAAHRCAGDVEEAVRARCPALADVIVHTDPRGG